MNRTSEDFIRLLEPIYNDGLKYCLALARNQSDAKDLLQESILAGIKGFRALKTEASFKQWFFTIITREFYTMYRKSVLRKNILNNVRPKTTEFPNVFQNEIDDPMQQALLSALKMLTENERAAILLFELGGFSIEEIKMMQGESSLSTIKSRLSRGRSKLKQLILEISDNILK